MDNVKRIASFSVNHDLIAPGMYVSRIDGDVTTYDLRTRRPNMGDYMDNLTMHSVEHLFATYVRNSAVGENIIYFGPMGCQTGFYLLTRGLDNGTVFDTVVDVLKKIISHEGGMFGARREECGNYRNLDVQAAQRECASYLESLLARGRNFEYPKE